jgi:hypothetical protein
MRRYFGMTAAIVVLAASARTQAPRPSSGPEIRTFVGAFMPTGAQRDDFKDATLFGVQLAREVSPYAHLLGSVSWAHGHNKFRTLSDNLTYIWQYDVGGEINALRELKNDWFFRPFTSARRRAARAMRASARNSRGMTARCGSMCATTSTASSHQLPPRRARGMTSASVWAWCTTSGKLHAIDQAPRVARDEQFLIGGNHPQLDA